MNELIEKIKSAQRILISTHQLPDGDGLGSEVALAWALESLNKRVQILNTDPTPSKFAFVDEEKHIQVFDPSKSLPSADLVIVLDTHDWKMMGTLAAPLSQMGVPVCFVDHHVPDSPSKENHFIDQSCQATGELVFKLLKKLGVTISRRIATALYMALLTDVKTLGFMGVSAELHRSMAELLDRGADSERVFLEIYSDDSLAKVRLFGHVLKDLKTAASGKIVWLEISRTLREHYSATIEDTEGYVDRLTLLKEIRVAILFREEANGKIKVSLRGLHGHKVLPLALRFGGGGHQHAAGMRVEGSLDKVVNAVCRAAESELVASG